MRQLLHPLMPAVAAALLVLLSGAASAPAATLVTLRTGIVVEGTVITLGDLFDGAGERAAAKVASAPEPGDRSIFRAEAIASLARANGLDWLRPSGRRTVAVRRASRIVPRDEIIDQLGMALLDRTEFADLEIELADRNLTVHVATDAAATVAVEDLRYDIRRGRFSAILLAPADAPHPNRISVKGRAYEITTVPVLRGHVATGRVIDVDDVELRRVRVARLGRDVIIDPKVAIGKSVRRRIRPGTPLRAGDLREPVAVAKGALVRMVYKINRLVLTASGKALDAGAIGDTIRVTNTRSRTTIEAVVARPGEVIARPGGRLVSNRR